MQLLALPTDLQKIIVGKLNPTDLCALERCCKTARDRIAKAQTLWKAIFANANNGYSLDNVRDWKTLVKEHTLVLRNLKKNKWYHFEPSEILFSHTVIAGRIFRKEARKIVAVREKFQFIMAPSQGSEFVLTRLDNDYSVTQCYTSVFNSHNVSYYLEGANFQYKTDCIPTAAEPGTISILYYPEGISIWYKTKRILTTAEAGTFSKEDNLLIRHSWKTVSDSKLNQMTIWNLENIEERADLCVPVNATYIATKNESVYCHDQRSLFIINWKKPNAIKKIELPDWHIFEFSFQINERYLLLNCYIKGWILSCENPTYFEDVPTLSNHKLVDAHIYGINYLTNELECYDIAQKKNITGIPLNKDSIDKFADGNYYFIIGDFVCLLELIYMPIQQFVRIYNRISGQMVQEIPFNYKSMSISSFAGLLCIQRGDENLFLKLGTWEIVCTVKGQFKKGCTDMINGDRKILNLHHIEPKRDSACSIM